MKELSFESRNPFNGELVDQFECYEPAHIDRLLNEAVAARTHWQQLGFARRAEYLRTIATLLRERQTRYAELITEEMGKVRAEAQAEVEKCAKACDYYADHGAQMLTDQPIATEAVDSYVTFQPMGTILAIMPWNFPFWQVFRFLAPVLMTGNTALLKHAPNVPRCALAIEELLEEAGVPNGVFHCLLIDVEQTARVIADERVQGVALTGSEAAGRKVAALAGQHLKKVVLELGGSDPLVVLEDADLEAAADVALKSRFSNAGQVCVSAKRVIVVEAIAEAFIEALLQRVHKLQHGDPQLPSTTLAPMARADLRDKVQDQVERCIEQGAKPLAGCYMLSEEGFFYPASVLDQVKPGMVAFDEEIFGPVAAIVHAADEAEALRLANQTRYGLGASVWTRDLERGDAFARQLEAGSCFVNALVGSDIRMPFGGIKSSGLGRELSHFGMQEFCNIKSIWKNR